MVAIKLCGGKDVNTNRQTKVPQSKQKLLNIGKAVSMSDNVSKTETTNYKDKPLSITAAKLHDGIDFDPSMSNDKVASSLSKDRKGSLYGDMNEALLMMHNVKDLSIESSINTSPIQNVGPCAQPSNVQSKSQMVLVNDIKSDTEKEIPVLLVQKPHRKQKLNFEEEEDEDSKSAQASNVEVVDVVPSGQQSIEEEKLPMPIRSHSYNVFTDRQECNTFLDCLYQKLSPSHNQWLNLVAHCLSQKDIPSFLSIYNSIKYHHPPDTTKKFQPL